MVAERRRALLGLLLSLTLTLPVRGAVVFETEWLSIQIDDTGAVRGLVDRRGGVNYGVPPRPAPLLALRIGGQFQTPQNLHEEKSEGTLILQYAEGVRAMVKAVAKTTHVTFELLSVQPQEKVEVVVWGPYPTAIKEVIGETVGVVRNDRFALGIQTLNVKTLGGYPTAENDIMPGRGDTAQPTDFGSVLQAFTRNRRQDRIIPNWGHESYFVPGYDDGGVIGSSVLTQDVTASQTEIPVADPKWFNQMENNTLRTVQIGRELLRYESVSHEPPWRLLGCRRGVYQTQPAAHSKGASASKLMDHAYKVFLTNAELSQEVARRLADLFNQTGLMQISFDGLEGNWSTGMGQYGRTLFVTTWYDHLGDDLRGRVINDASNPGHYFWHIYTRMNWGEPWYAGFRESQTEYRLKNQDYFRRNLMPCMLGWFNMTAQTSLEDIEWLLARTAGFDAGFALNTGLQVVRDNGLGESILQTIKAWETARMSGAFSDAQKRRLQDIDQEFHLEALDGRSWNLYPVYSSKHTLAQQVQPGQPTEAIWELNNPYGPQPLQFILQVSGDTPISDLTLKIDDAEEIPVPVTFQPGSILKYSGTGHGIVYDKRWKELEKVVLNPSVLQISSGRHQVGLGCRFQTADQPAVKIEFRTFGKADKVVAGGTGESPSQKVAVPVKALSGSRADSMRETRLESW